MKRLVAGPHAVREALHEGASRMAVVYAACDASAAVRQVCHHAQARGVAVEQAPRVRLDQLAGGLRHQGIVALTGDFPYRNAGALIEGLPPLSLVVALDRLTDPRNFGAVVRSAVAFGADALLTLRDHSAPVTPVVVRASAGATERAAIGRITNLARTLGQLQERQMQIVGLEASGRDALETLSYPPAGRVLVIGAEGRGLRRLVRARCDALCRLELPGPVEALNASVAAGIALYLSHRARAAERV